MSNASLPRLVILQPSHFCEKARWALQRYGIAHDVDVHAPGFHMMATKGKGSTPCLFLPDGTFKDDSTLILRWIDEQQQLQGSTKPKLFPTDCEAAVAADCALFDAGLGVDARLVVYAHGLDTTAVYNALMANVPWWQTALMTMGVWYVTKGIMRKGMHVTPENGAAALERVRLEFQRVSKLLEDGRPFLHGNKFTAADLAFAALSAPVVGVTYGDHPTYANPDDKPQALKDINAELRATPAGAFALRMWETQRKVVL
jgi:glutathione S-transferase